MGDGGELERALDDAFGIKITVRPHCEKLICENTLQKTLNSPTVVKVFQNKSGQAVEKSSDLISGLFGFIKATKFRDSSGISECVQNILVKSYLPCQCLYLTIIRNWIVG